MLKWIYRTRLVKATVDINFDLMMQQLNDYIIYLYFITVFQSSVFFYLIHALLDTLYLVFQDINCKFFRGSICLFAFIFYATVFISLWGFCKLSWLGIESNPINNHFMAISAECLFCWVQLMDLLFPQFKSVTN